MAGKSTRKPAEKPNGSPVVVLATPKVPNLHNLEAVRREMARVYRDMRAGHIASQDGARLVYVLGQMRVMFEAADPANRVIRAEIAGRDGVPLQYGGVTKEELAEAIRTVRDKF